MGVEDERHWALSLVTVPTLNSVDILCHALSDDSLTWVANCIPSIAPHITNFYIDIVPGPTQWLDLSRYSSLTALRLHGYYVVPRFWESLSSCQHLRRVVLHACRRIEERDGELGWRVDWVDFPALRTLKTRFGNPAVVFELVLRSRMPMLERLCWKAGCPQPWDCVAAHLKLYSRKLDSDMLSRPKWDNRDKLYYFGTSDLR
ncbi:hypothetical protein M407DRAFT_184766 [Tulasnella calospora MUT 4182]|uniref:Uncharacterized protein n=1 Tax=Tulasnella calospora MUT 4182 TaxID=1051891 RepID=A0A0C3M2X8_9AGAM|nr:hypothetical protein M407DRAFT_184766 [Tulasnella calospora MUT 4182]